VIFGLVVGAGFRSKAHLGNRAVLTACFPQAEPRQRNKSKRFQSLDYVIQLSSNLRKSSIDRS
jgi:hypothetical protein